MEKEVIVEKERLVEVPKYIKVGGKEGLEFDAINKNTNSEVFNVNKISRKVVADLYIDDRNLGGLGDWRENYRKISGKELPK